MTFAFKSLEAGPAWVQVQGGFHRPSAAHAYALDWFDRFGYTILADEACPDVVGCRDFMVARNGAIRQYAIEGEAAKPA